MEEGNFNRRQLFKEIMDKNWASVVELYKNNPSVRRAKVTRTEQTVLHLAVLQKDANVVEQLVQDMNDDEARDILTFKNDLGGTPLHVAAALGLAKICWLLAEKCKELVVSARNNVGETPLYVSVHHGKKKAFFVLRDYVPTSLMSNDLSFCQRGDGNTILHAAVHGTYFELVIEIIKFYPRLVNFNNDMGQSPLHLLANKPLVFRSGSPPPDIFKKLLYSCIIVSPLLPEQRRGVSLWQKEKEIEIPHYYARLEIGLTIIGLFYRLMVLRFAERFTKRRQSSMDNNQDGLHAPSSEDQERGRTDEGLNQLGPHDIISTEPASLIFAEWEMEPHDISSIELPHPYFFCKLSQPENYQGPKLKEDPRNTVFNFLKIVINVLMVPLRIGYTAFNFLKMQIRVLMDFLKIGIPIIEIAKREKTMYEHANQVMKELVNLSSYWEFDESGKINTPNDESSINRSESSEGEIMQIERQQKDKGKEADKPIRDSPILGAAKMGIVEMVKNIIDTFPIAIEDLDSNHMNIILLSAKHRQLKVYKHMLERRSRWDSVFAVVDKDGNNALHLAASATRNNSPRVIAGPALQMHWEIKWYKFVRDSMEPSFFQDYNNNGQTSKEIFSETHESLIKEGREWMRNTSQSCSVIAALIATVAFAFSITVPGGVDQTTGFPILRGKLAFSVFAKSAAVALFLSIISMLMFLNTFTTHYQEWHFESYVPGMLSIGLITLFTSIISMLISFIANYILVMEDYKSLPIFICSCIPVILAMLQLSVYKDMARVVPSDIPELFM